MQTVEFIEIDEHMGLAVRECRPMEFGVRTGDGLPRVRILRQPDWDALAPHCPLVDDRGTKHKAKGLSAYLPKGEGVPVVRADYENAGRCMQSVEALLGSGGGASGVLFFVLVVGSDIYNELAKRARDTSLGTLHGKALREGRSTDPDELILRHLGRVPPDHPSRRKLIGASPKLEMVRSMAERASRCDLPVLILGDSGTGKEVTAKLIHNGSKRGNSGHLHAVNCAAIPGDLLESELFGSVRGAFTGAMNKKGLWELAQDGTLFLDEIGDLSLHHQAKILRVLEEGVAHRVGSEKDYPVNARIIAATHRDIEGNVRTEKFRRDLYYRLYGIRILLPSLDECPADIAILAAHFWKEIVGNPSARLSHDLCSLLESMSWPGNGRQLKSLLKRVHHLFDTDEPTVEHFHLLRMHEGIAIKSGTCPTASPGVSVQMECLTHLRRTAAALHSVELILRRLGRNGGRPGYPPELSGVRWANLKMSVGEIRALCREPLLFGSERLFRGVESLVEALDEINATVDGPPEKDMCQSGSTPEILNRIESTMREVFSGTQELLARL